MVGKFPSFSLQNLCPQCQAEDSRFKSALWTEDYHGPVRSFGELCQAYQFVHDHYVELGYMRPLETKMRYSILDLLPSSSVFISCNGTTLAGTISVVQDNLAGLPLGCAFSAELDYLRALGETLAECTMFACNTVTSLASASHQKLMQWVFSWCCINDISKLCIVVHPKHLNFWHKIVGFEILAATRHCQHVKENPGIMLTLDIAGLVSGKKQPTAFIKKFRRIKIDPSAFVDDYRPDDQEVASLLLANKPALKTITRYQLALINRFYPLAVKQILALATDKKIDLELRGLEPLTPGLQSRCSTN